MICFAEDTKAPSEVLSDSFHSAAYFRCKKKFFLLSLISKENSFIYKAPIKIFLKAHCVLRSRSSFSATSVRGT